MFNSDNAMVNIVGRSTNYLKEVIDILLPTSNDNVVGWAETSFVHEELVAFSTEDAEKSGVPLSAITATEVFFYSEEKEAPVKAFILFLSEYGMDELGKKHKFLKTNVFPPSTSRNALKEIIAGWFTDQPKADYRDEWFDGSTSVGFRAIRGDLISGLKHNNVVVIIPTALAHGK